MDISDLVVKGIKALIPPNTNDLGPQQRWRWMVFAAIVALTISQALHIAVACGYIPYLSGFALDVSVQQLQAQVNLSTQILLERDMKDKQKELCATKNQPLKRELGDDIDNLQRQYFNITNPHHYYKLRGCGEL